MVRAPITVASIPAAHSYIQHLSEPTGDQVRRLPDPPPLVADPQPGQWWPPVMLDADWVSAHAAEFDVMHLHFGFDAAAPADLGGWIAALRRQRRPLVMTVHDLINPHFADPTTHLAQLDVLIPAADAIVTLTRSAAAEIERRWHRTATVIEHPHVVPLDRLPATALRQPRTDRFVIGVHAKNLRANLDPLPVLDALVAVLPTMRTAVLQVNVHREVLGTDFGDARAAAFRRWVDDHREHPQVDVRPHRRFTDDELWDYLEQLDLSVLPYRFGTHSGWLEACVDLGTGVLVPDTGHYRDQHGHPSYTLDPAGADSLGSVVRRIHARDISATPARPDRRRQRSEIASRHLEVYRRVQGGAGGQRPPGHHLTIEDL